MSNNKRQYQSIMDKNRERASESFFPKAWECMDCKGKISLYKDSFIPPCCGEGIVCYDCYSKDQTEIRCRLCNKRTLYVRIKAQFFRNIEETAWALTKRNSGSREKYQCEHEPRIAILV